MHARNGKREERKEKGQKEKRKGKRRNWITERVEDETLNDHVTEIARGIGLVSEARIQSA